MSFMRLEDAAKAVFGERAPSTRSLREAARTGRLEAYYFAGRWWTTPENVVDMVRGCRSPCAPVPTLEGERSAAAGRAQAAIDALRGM
jgi:hypothetical protein